MSTYKLPDPEKVLPKLTPEIIAASAFVTEVDGGGPMSQTDGQILRDALNDILCGADPRKIFKNQPRPGRSRTAGRNFIVAVYVESRRRFYERNGLPPSWHGAGRTVLQRAKSDAAEAFNWSDCDVDDPESAVQDAWTQWEEMVKGYSAKVIDGALAKWRDSGE